MLKDSFIYSSCILTGSLGIWCKITLSLITEKNSRKHRLESRKCKFSDVKNLAHFKDAEVFTLKCYKFILT